MEWMRQDTQCREGGRPPLSFVDLSPCAAIDLRGVKGQLHGYYSRLRVVVGWHLAVAPKIDVVGATNKAGVYYRGNVICS
jgi:hypothetical protein